MRRSVLLPVLFALVAPFFLGGPSTARATDTTSEAPVSFVMREAVEIGDNGLTYRESISWTERACAQVRTARGVSKVCKNVTFTQAKPVKVRFCISQNVRGKNTNFCSTQSVSPKLNPQNAPAQTPSATPTLPVPLPSASPKPSRTPVLLPEADAGSYVFTKVDAQGEPVRFEVCRTLNWSVAGTPAEQALTRQAVAELAAASSLQFREVPYDGYRPLLDELPSAVAHPVQLVLRWYDTEELPDFNGSVAGLTETRMWTIGSSGRSWISFAAIAIERDTDSVTRRGGNSTWAVMLHELGHAVGLSHTTHRDQLMYPSTSTATADHYQNGDLAGLARVGRLNAACSE